MPRKSAFFMERTKVPAAKTAQEIIEMLGAAGASSVSTNYKDGRPSAMSFTMNFGQIPVHYQLPARTEAIAKAFQKAGRTAPPREQCDAIGWRQLYRWLQAQLALVQTGMTTTAEVFTPYAMSDTGQTVFQLWQANVQKQIEAPK